MVRAKSPKTSALSVELRTQKNLLIGSSPSRDSSATPDSVRTWLALGMNQARLAHRSADLLHRCLRARHRFPQHLAWKTSALSVELRTQIFELILAL